MTKNDFCIEEKIGINEKDISGILNNSTRETPLSIYLKIKGMYPEEEQPSEYQSKIEGFEPLYWGKIIGDLIQIFLN